MFNTNFPEAFSEEYQEFEQACKVDARNIEILMGFGFSESEAFQMVMDTPAKKETPIEELLAFFS